MIDPEEPPQNWRQLDNAVRLYVRLAGHARLTNPRKFLIELPAGTVFVPIDADGIVLEAVSDAPPLSDADAPKAGTLSEGIDEWIKAVSGLPCFSRRPPDMITAELGQDINVTPGMALTSTVPLWIVGAQPSAVLPDLADKSVFARALPVFGALCATFAGQGDVRAVDTQTLLNEYGTNAVDEAASLIGTAIAAWYQVEREAEFDRASEAAATDESRLLRAQNELNAATSTTKRKIADDIASDPLLAAIAVIGQSEGFTVLRPPEDVAGTTRYRELENAALSSNFRYRKVELDGPWWQEEGPPILMFENDTGTPMAATWQAGRYQVIDPRTGQQEPATAATQVEARGYVLYPGLPDVVTPGSLLRFALHGSKDDMAALLWSGLVAMLIGLLVPIATGVIVATALPDGRLDLLWEMAFLVAAAAIGSAGFAAGRAFATIRLSSRVDLRLQPALWDRLLRLPLHFFRTYTTGDLVQRVLAVDTIRQLLTGPVLSGLLSGVFASLSFFLMLFYDVRLAIYGFGFAAVTATVIFLLARHEIGFLRQFRDSQGRVTARIVELLTGIPKLRFAAAEERGFARWAYEFSAQQHASWMAGRVRAVLGVLIAILSPLGFLGVFLVAGYRTDPIELAAFAAFSAAFGQFVGAVSVLAFSLGTALQAIPLLERMTPILEQQPEVDVSRADPGQLQGGIEVRDLTFSYRHGDTPVLQDISFSAKPGEFIAVAGPSGAGKSTLLRLLLGFETPQSGAVYYDGHDLAQLDLRLARRQIGTVLQVSGLVPGSLYENIAGASPLTDEEVMEAARQAGIADDIEAFPMGLETFVAEDSGSVSGGQRQRIMIARALVRKPPILYFDEATSALDNRTQAIVSTNIERLNVTRIVVAHRLSTIRNADNILMFEAGRLVESGTHDELMAARGAFFRLAERQLV